MTLLTVSHLGVGYRGGGRGTEDVNLEVSAGQVIAIIGATGAGKSSLIRGIGGFLSRESGFIRSGKVIFDGTDVTRLSALQRFRLGISVVLEREKVFADMSVRENLVLPIPRHARRAATLNEMLDLFPALSDHLERNAGVLSGGQRQMLALASALCALPKLLLIDELSLGLAPETALMVVRALRSALDATSASAVVAEERPELVRELTEHSTRLVAGRVEHGGVLSGL